MKLKILGQKDKLLMPQCFQKLTAAEMSEKFLHEERRVKKEKQYTQRASGNYFDPL